MGYGNWLSPKETTRREISLLYATSFGMTTLSCLALLLTIKRVSTSKVLEQPKLILEPAGGKALVKLVPPETLLEARAEKRAIADAKAANKAASQAAERAKRAQKLEKGRLAPADMFKPPRVAEGTYGSWDDKGLPLTDAEGKELSKSAGKKAAKEWAVQQKLHEEFLKWREEEDKQD